MRPCPSRALRTQRSRPLPIEPLEARTLLSSSYIPIANALDSVYDTLRQRLYVTTDSNTVLRYDVNSRQFLAPWTLGSHPVDLDISPDSATLFLADDGNGNLHAIDLASDAVTSYASPIAGYFATGVAVLNDGTVILKESDHPSFINSYFTSLFSFDTATHAFTPLPAGVPGGAHIVRSGDQAYGAAIWIDNALLYRGGALSSHITGSFLTAYQRTTLNADATALAAMDTYGNGVRFDWAHNDTKPLPLTGNKSLGFAANHPWLFLANSSSVFVYDASSLALLAQLPLDQPATDGILRVADDDSHLFVPVAGGYRDLSLPESFFHPQLTFTLSPASDIVAGMPVLFSAAVVAQDPAESNGAAPTGTVTFYDVFNGIESSLATIPINAGIASFSAPLTAGTHLLRAVYSGDRFFLAHQSTAVSITASPAHASLSLGISLSDGNPLAPRTLLARLTPLNHSVAPFDGTVSFYDGDTLLGSRTLDANGAAQLTVTLDVGDHSLIAVYGGGYFVPTTSYTLPVSVRLPTTTTLALSTQSPGYLDITVMGGLSGFHDVILQHAYGDAQITRVETFNGAGKIALSDLPAGDLYLEARFAGDAWRSASTSALLAVHVDKHSSTLRVTLDVTGPSTVINISHIFGGRLPAGGQIHLYDNYTLVRIVDAGLPLINIHLPKSIGRHIYMAAYTGDDNHDAVNSAEAIVSIEPAVTATTLTASTSHPVAGGRVTLTATVTPAVPGTVTFFEGDAPLGTMLLSQGKSTLTVSDLPAGSHTYTARFNPTAGDRPSTSSPLTVQAVNVSVIDLLAVYTTQTLTAAGSLSNLLEFLRKEIGETNAAFANSGVPALLRLVGAGWVNYKESNNLQTDLTRLATTGDTYLEEAVSLRNALGADLVVLVNSKPAPDPDDPSARVAGVARLFGTDVNTPDPERNAFLVINQQSRNQFLLAHEAGHSLGAGHVRGDDGTDSASAPDGHGYRFTAGDGIQYRDIMAYAPGTQIPYFSNPELLYKGHAIGDAYSNAARVLRATAPTVANYRPARLLTQLDQFDGTRITGWAFDPRASDAPISLRLDVDGKPFATFDAASDRLELQASFGSSRHGFSYTLPHLAEGSHTLALYATDAAGESVLVRARTVISTPMLFDEAHYLAAYPDVSAAVSAGRTTAWAHFTQAGQFEQRTPSPFFEPAYYLARNPDIAAAASLGQISSPWQHFLHTGQFEQRQASPWFDERFYRLANPDVDAAIAAGRLRNGLEHFLQQGITEYRRPIALFNAETYAQALAARGLPAAPVPFAHFLSVGLPSDLIPIPSFDPATYLDANPDVKAALASGAFLSAFDHFARSGWRENRRFSPLFSESAYLAKNPDVAAAVQSGRFLNGFEHYLLAGRFEKRAT